MHVLDVIAENIHESITKSEYGDNADHCAYEVIEAITLTVKQKYKRQIAIRCCELDWPPGTIKGIKKYFNLVY